MLFVAIDIRTLAEATARALVGGEGDELRELDIEVAISAGFLAPEIQCAEFLMNRAKRDAAN